MVGNCDQLEGSIDKLSLFVLISSADAVSSQLYKFRQFISERVSKHQQTNKLKNKTIRNLKKINKCKFTEKVTTYFFSRFFSEYIGKYIA